MNKLYLLLLTISLVACKNDTSYVTLSGSVANPNSSEFKLLNPAEQEPLKVFTLDDKNSFKDTITLPKGTYYLTDGTEYMMLYLQPGDDLSFSLDADKFDESLHFSGKGKEVNTYLVEKILKQDGVFDLMAEWANLEEEAFNQKFDSVKTSFNELLTNLKNADPDFVMEDNTRTEELLNFLSQEYAGRKEMNKMIGTPSPSFEDYENHKGGKTSLADLRGKYVYIDVWATWCKPCLAEIPDLKKLEEKYGTQMHFVSISVDREKDYDTWKDMVNDKELKGLQLFAHSDGPSEFDEAYNINSIPRFILIDPQGNILNPDASRPSDTKTDKLFQSLLKS
jgi:thiol-disulfide isomerase/thioredoxin